MKKTKTYSEYGRSSEELWEFFMRFGKMPDLSQVDWFDSPEQLTPNIIKLRIRRMASHLKTAVPMSRLIHWGEPDVSLKLAMDLGIKIRRRETHVSLNCLLANLYQVSTLGQTDVMSISLNNNSYRTDPRANPLGVKDSISKYVTALANSNQVTKHTGYHDRTGREKSRNTALVLSDPMIDSLLEHELPNVEMPEIEPIRWVIRNDKHRYIPQNFVPTDLPNHVQRYRGILLDYNDFIRSHKVTVSRPNVREFHDCIAFHIKYYGEDLAMHSRVSGGRFQFMRKELRRSYLQINGEKTVEVDIAESHPTILHALAGKPLGGDLLGKSYWLTDSEPDDSVRDATKVAIACMLNTNSRSTATSAITHSENMGEIDLPETLTTKMFVEKILERHPSLKPYFFKSESGMRAMEQEGKLMLDVMHWGMNSSVPVLPLHDALICRESDAERVSQALQEAAQRVLGTSLMITIKRE
ncbi:hypothetical protein N8Z80_01190 [Litorivicinus sp.]|nr:hypothetical protein [Litorivicinus sp.]